MADMGIEGLFKIILGVMVLLIIILFMLYLKQKGIDIVSPLFHSKLEW